MQENHLLFGLLVLLWHVRGTDLSKGRAGAFFALPRLLLFSFVPRVLHRLKARHKNEASSPFAWTLLFQQGADQVLFVLEHAESCVRYDGR